MARALILNHNLREQGTWFRARKVAEGLHRRGWDVTFVYTGAGWYRPRRVESEPGWTAWETASWARVREAGHGAYPLGFPQRLAICRGRYGLIHTFSHFPPDQGVARLVRLRGGFWMADWCDLWNSREGGLHDISLWRKPLPDFLRGLPGAHLRAVYRIEDALEAGALTGADGVSVIASPLRERALRLGVPSRHILDLVSGADTGAIRPLPPGECRRALGLPEDALIVGYVANTTPDSVQLAGAMAHVWRADPRVVLLTAGPEWDPGSPLFRRAARAGLYRHLGPRPFGEVSGILGAADILAMPLRDVPFNHCRWPNKFGDYLAAGRPVATTAVGDMGRLTERHRTGIAGEATAEGLAGAILALAASPGLRTECGRNARAHAERFLNWDRQVDRLLAFLRRRGVRTPPARS